MLFAILAALLASQEAVAAPAPGPPPDWAKLPTGMPTFAQRPHAAHINQHFPQAPRLAGVSGRVSVRCTATAAGELADCSVATERPAGQGFGEAALQLAKLFRLNRRMTDGSPVAGVPVVLPIHFEAREDELVQRPVWVKRPDAEAVVRFHPPGARRLRLKGQTLIECAVARSGDMERCTVLSEDPEGYGFGAAALKLSRLHRMAQIDADGRPTAGRQVMIPISFTLR